LTGEKKQIRKKLERLEALAGESPEYVAVHLWDVEKMREDKVEDLRNVEDAKKYQLILKIPAKSR
jgi:hypothetical protein